jgi:hypothetical protein
MFLRCTAPILPDPINATPKRSIDIYITVRLSNTAIVLHPASATKGTILPIEQELQVSSKTNKQAKVEKRVKKVKFFENSFQSPISCEASRPQIYSVCCRSISNSLLIFVFSRWVAIRPRMKVLV